jgi:hypothetical protein
MLFDEGAEQPTLLFPEDCCEGLLPWLTQAGPDLGNRWSNYWAGLSTKRAAAGGKKERELSARSSG